MLRLVALLLLATPALAQPPAPAGPVSRIAFGSCADQNKPCPIWDKLTEAKPDLTLMLGDTIYADIENGKLKKPTAEKIKTCWDELAALPAWQKLRKSSYMLATWDDHDYGLNDAGVEWEHKDAAQTYFHDFFGTPADSPRRTQKGVYHAETFGPESKRVQVILLDTRYFRTALRKDTKRLPGTTIIPYLPVTDAGATMLGADQWKWLEAELKKPAEVRILVSSIQLVSDDHPFEKWANMPNERQKLYDLIKSTGANGVVVVSGDRHLGEISLDTTGVGYPLYDATSSGLNQASQTFRLPEKNRQRVSAMPYGNNFGMIVIDWAKPDPTISLQLRHEDGEISSQVRVPLSKLRAKAGAQPAGAKDPAKAVPLPDGVVSPAEAIKKVGDEVTVQFAVAAGRVVSGGKRILLNSDADFKAKDNFTVVVNEKAMTGPFDKATFDTFKGKTVRAKGKVTEFKDAPQIQIDDAKNLEIVEAKKE